MNHAGLVYHDDRYHLGQVAIAGAWQTRPRSMIRNPETRPEACGENLC